MKNRWILAGSFLLVLGACFCIGLSLSRHKPLWNDEIFTQVSVIESQSYLDIVLLRPSGEGNRCPLFYVIQKAAMDIANFHLPFQWHREWFVVDPHSQAVMRLPTIFFMSMTIATIFIYFFHGYSLLSGILALVITLSSYCIWIFWAEARPYSLWMFLTACQVLLGLRILTETGSPRKFLWNGLAWTHVALSLTIVFSAAQVIVMSAVLGIWKEKSWKRYFGVTILPLVLSVIFYFHTPRSTPVLAGGTPEDQIWSNFSATRLTVVCLFCLVLIYIKSFKYPWAEKSSWEEAEKTKPFFFFSIFMFLVGWAILTLLKIMAGGRGTLCLLRYFVFLTPVAIVATTTAFIHLGRMFRPHKVIFAVLLICAVGIMAGETLRIFVDLVIHNALNLMG